MTQGIIDPRYGDASATAPPWEDIERLLTEAQRYWIITVRRDGRPHAVPLVGVWHDGAFHFCTGTEEQKERNLDTNQRVAVTTSSPGATRWTEGKDVVVEGEAERVNDPDELRTLADAWYAKYQPDWHFEVRGDAFYEVTDNGAGGGGGAQVYRVRPAKVLAFGDEHGQTRYPF